MKTKISNQERILRDLLFTFSGAVFVLLITSLEGIFLFDTPSGFSGQMLQITGWYGAWLVVQLFSLFFAMRLLFAADWRELPLSDKSGLFFGFLSVSWFSLLALDLRLSVLLSFYWHLMVGILGIAMLLAFLLFRSRHNKAEELFP